jgi:hypothetical protein
MRQLLRRGSVACSQCTGACQFFVACVKFCLTDATKFQYQLVRRGVCCRTRRTNVSSRVEVDDGGFDKGEVNIFIVYSSALFNVTD